jgi:hypothetical protein
VFTDLLRLANDDGRLLVELEIQEVDFIGYKSADGVPLNHLRTLAPIFGLFMF